MARLLLGAILLARAAGCAPGSCPEAATGQLLLQRMETKISAKQALLSSEKQVPLVFPKELQDVSMPAAETVGVASSPQMLVFVMLLLMCLLCALVEGIGRFLAHAVGFFLDDASESARDTSRTEATEKDLSAVGAVRLIGAIHLVCYNFGPASWAGFNAWGASWFSLYFVLSGLGSAHLKLQHVSPLSWLPLRQNFIRHLAIVYPLYLLALCWCCFNTLLLQHQEQTVPHLADLLLETLMLQSFLPQGIVRRLNGPGWFFSALAFCWFLEEALFRLGRWCWERGRLSQKIACLGVLVWVVLWPFAAPGKLIRLEDNIPALSFIHCYFCGVLMAYCLHAETRDSAAKSSKISGTGAVLISAALFGIGDKATADAWSRFILLPAQCLLIYSLVRDSDPLARLCSAWPLRSISELAIGIYVFQAPAKSMLDARMGWSGQYDLQQLVVLLVLLAIVAALAQQLLQKPLAQWLTK
mmetsp:Transcript_19722/g.37081  ORF Transcript_19722/g.37081 Transcript_19722/m.37081 type:complete len:471 (+) Transcript_19722:65-1477(+)